MTLHVSEFLKVVPLFISSSTYITIFETISISTQKKIVALSTKLSSPLFHKINTQVVRHQPPPPLWRISFHEPQSLFKKPNTTHNYHTQAQSVVVRGIAMSSIVITTTIAMMMVTKMATIASAPASLSHTTLITPCLR